MDKTLNKATTQLLSRKERTSDVSMKCKETWKQVKSTTGPSPPQTLTAQCRKAPGHQSLLVHQEKNFVYYKIIKNKYNHFSRILRLANDIETNPGPKVSIQMYNVRGLKEYNRTKKILNHFHPILRQGLGIAVIQETHLTEQTDTNVER